MTAPKSPKKSQHQRRGVATDPSLRGRGPAKGAPNAGRPPDAFKAEMAALADRWRQAAKAKGILDDPEHPHWMNAGKFAHEMAHGRPNQAVDLTSGGLPMLTTDERNARLLALLAKAQGDG
jgi:hypothetical protein